ncbi:MAG: HAD family phosphatase [Kiritimatiellae bacterium]|nr:HAD family phosphatase [Kiritimatiellia bacterium]
MARDGKGPAGVVFDFDGVLADSERVHCRTLSEVLEEMGFKGVGWEEYARDLMGFDDRDAFRSSLEARGAVPEEGLVRRCVAEKARRFAALAEAGEVPAMPGAAAFVRECAARVPVGLCSGALRSDTGPVLRKMGLEDVFSAVVTAEDVAKSKPDPESYRLCAERLGVDAARCVAFEDSEDGVRSARGAGFRVAGVMTTLGEAELRAAGAEWVVAGLGEAAWEMFG